MPRSFKSLRHTELARTYPSELMPRGYAGTGPHRRRAPSRAKRYLALIALACCYGLYRCLTNT